MTTKGKKENVMKFKNIFFSIFFVTVLVLLPACGKNGTDETSTAGKTEGTEENTDSNVVSLKPEALSAAGIIVEPIVRKTLSPELSFTGKISVDETRIAHISPRISGRAYSVNAKLGDFVNKGSLLAGIDSQELGEAQSTYLKAKVALKVATMSYERAKKILEGKAISSGEFQRREGEFLSASADAKAAEDRLHLFGMTDKEISSMEEMHGVNSKAGIYSPIAGTVIERHLTLGEIVEPANTLFVIADLSKLWVLADVMEKDIPIVKKGQTVVLSVLAYPEKVFTGTVSHISETIDSATRAVKVRAEVDNPDGLLKPEMFVTVKIRNTEKENVLAIPETAIQQEGGKKIVFVAKNDYTFEKREVSVGPSMSGFHQVLDGVKEGERIVVKGGFILKSETMKEMMEEE